MTDDGILVSLVACEQARFEVDRVAIDRGAPLASAPLGKILLVLRLILLSMSLLRELLLHEFISIGCIITVSFLNTAALLLVRLCRGRRLLIVAFLFGLLKLFFLGNASFNGQLARLVVPFTAACRCVGASVLGGLDPAQSTHSGQPAPLILDSDRVLALGKVDTLAKED